MCLETWSCCCGGGSLGLNSSRHDFLFLLRKRMKDFCHLASSTGFRQRFESKTDEVATAWKLLIFGSLYSCLALQWLCFVSANQECCLSKEDNSPISCFDWLMLRCNAHSSYSSGPSFCMRLVWKHKLCHSESLRGGLGEGEGGRLPQPRMHSDIFTIIASLQRVHLANGGSCAGLLLAHLWRWVTVQLCSLRRCRNDSKSWTKSSCFFLHLAELPRPN